MFLQFHKLRIHFESGNALIDKRWHALFFTGTTPGINLIPRCDSPDIHFQLKLVESLPHPPANQLAFSDANLYPGSGGILSVYDLKGERLLHFHDGALVNVPLPDAHSNKKMLISGQITKSALNNGRFEDITFTSLAPLLRRRGYFLLHAFAACKANQAVLLVGPSGSGKTTTGLNLLLNGWKLLANDILLLTEKDGFIFALPTPGSIGIRPNSVSVLPQLRPLIGNVDAGPGQIDLTSHFAKKKYWAGPAPVTAIYFPMITPQEISTLHPEQRAVCLARLMAESIDKWDNAMLPAHIALLQQLSRQVTPCSLHLGQDISPLSDLLAHPIQHR